VVVNGDYLDVTHTAGGRGRCVRVVQLNDRSARCQLEMGRYIRNIDISFRYRYIVPYRIVHSSIKNFDISIFSIYRFKISKSRRNKSMDINGIYFPFCSIT